MALPEGKFKVLTMSYDDGRTADKKLVRIFNRYKIKATFHLNAGLMNSNDRLTDSDVQHLYAGHEVSAHTLTHPTIARCPKEQILTEILEDRKRLETLVGYTVRGLSYPNGSYNSQVKAMLPHLGIEYARTVHSTGNFAMPDDFHEWNPTCHHKRNLMEIAHNFVELFKSQYLYMMYVWGHSYEFDQDNNWDLIEGFCEFMGGRDDIWYASNIEIVDYLKAFQNLRFSADSSFVFNPTARSVWLNVDGQVVEIPSGSQVHLS